MYSCACLFACAGVGVISRQGHADGGGVSSFEAIGHAPSPQQQHSVCVCQFKPECSDRLDALLSFCCGCHTTAGGSLLVHPLCL